MTDPPTQKQWCQTHDERHQQIRKPRHGSQSVMKPHGESVRGEKRQGALAEKTEQKKSNQQRPRFLHQAHPPASNGKPEDHDSHRAPDAPSIHGNSSQWKQDCREDRPQCIESRQLTRTERQIFAPYFIEGGNTHRLPWNSTYESHDRNGYHPPSVKDGVTHGGLGRRSHQ